MDEDRVQVSWVPTLGRARGPLYLAIADEIAADIAAGRLNDGMRLPPQRALAATLGIDFTTVSRAYNEARRRGMVEGRVGQGTYVKARRRSAGRPTAGGLVDMSMNLPPLFDDPALTARMWMEVATLDQRDPELLMRYQPVGGTERDRAAGAAWLKPRLGDVPADRLVVCTGAQGALLASVGTLATRGDNICAEALAYPGLRSLAAFLGIGLVSVGIDRSGILPEAFEAACVRYRPRALYCNPTLHNPTTATLPPERREAIVAIARRHGVAIIEDDAYGALPANPAPPLAALAPDLVYHVAGLAKCLSPALRIAYLVAPDRSAAVRLEGAIRATAGMTSPLSAAIATRWLEDGTAQAVLAAIRAEAGARQQIAIERLAGADLLTDREGFHLWLKLPSGWNRGEFTAQLRTAGIGVVASDAFSISDPPEAVRLGLGAAPTRDQLRHSLDVIAGLLLQSPAAQNLVV
ncbi:PLP-dependent aminotransferase family protein [Mesorhizobium plurifarium]|uniref:aminotransferase-like domain-containing protein n=1 Tax=Sinorhizobium arboris TaxID=76745 RepID=UPI00041756D5|nr:PLP-dependent aminotransferase family protein [Sinorhizobium arboris]PST22047.1 PLP-dependent aminotransferase family protein [Mesorhizobium plurifarium]